MKFPILASVIIFCLVINHAVRKNTRRQQALEDAFWERERQANATRRQSLDGLNYITIPLDKLPTDLLPEDETVQGYVETLRGLAETIIVNLTGYTNTDLKLQYGAPNITLLTQYDQNYTVLVSTLQLRADALLKIGHTEEAVKIMEFAVSVETDVSRTYYRLAEYYLSLGRPEELNRLTQTAQKLRSSNRDQVLRQLASLSASEA